MNMMIFFLLYFKTEISSALTDLYDIVWLKINFFLLTVLKNNIY